jgi:hypothetical protein
MSFYDRSADRQAHSKAFRLSGEDGVEKPVNKDEETAAAIEDNFSLHISIIATDILEREVGVVLVLPKHLSQ